MVCQLRERKSRPTAHRPALHQPTILCVDDDPDIAAAIEMRLRPFSVQVECAFCGMQGIWEAVRQRPDLILIDLAMPNGDGHYILKCLKENDETASIPIIVLTGLRDPQLRRKVLHAGAEQYLRKPVRSDDLLHNIGRYVDLRPRGHTRRL